MIRHRSRCVLAILALSLVGLAACGDDGGGTTDPIDAPAIDTAGVAQTCESYCTTIATNCTGAEAQYSATADCMNTCLHWPTGTAADMMGVTRGCHIYHAGVAAGAPLIHCRHAGPGGDGACGSNCEGFCTLVLGACAGQANPPYASMGACMTACGGFATTPVYSAAVTGGNSLSCRLYHATAASSNPGLHCAHTGTVSATCN